MAEWQPIATAPKDGTRVLVAAPSHLTMIGAWLEKRVTYMEGKWWSNNAPIIPDPTHWQPLPEPPVSAQERE